MNRHLLFKLFFFSCLFCTTTEATSQKIIQETYYYNPRGFTFIPALKKPSIIYQGKLFVGRKQLTSLFATVNNAHLNTYFKKYKSNKTTSAILNVASFGLSLYSLIDWRAGDRDFNWYTFGGGLLLTGVSGYLDAKGNEQLRNAALVFDNATRSTTFVPRQKTIRFTIPLSR